MATIEGFGFLLLSLPLIANAVGVFSPRKIAHIHTSTSTRHRNSTADDLGK